MKPVKQWRNMIRSLGWRINCSSKGILNYLEAIYGRFWQSVQEWITIIKFWYNQWICKDYSRGNIQWWSNLTKLSNLVICRFAYWRDVFSQRQATIKSNTKVSCRCWGWDYVTTKDYWGRLNLISLLRVANYEKFSLWWIDRKTIWSEPCINFIKGGGEQGETVIRLAGWKWNVNLRVVSIQMIWNWSLCKDLTDRVCIQWKKKRTKDRTL